MGGRVGKQDQSGVMRPHVGIVGTAREERGDDRGRERKEWQADCGGEKRKKGEIITHRATCKTKYHLVAITASNSRDSEELLGRCRGSNMSAAAPCCHSLSPG